MSEWISVKDRLPEDDQTVLGWHPFHTAALPIICWYDKESNGFIPAFTFQDMHVVITHWMPLPEPPDIERIKIGKMLQEDYNKVLSSIWRPEPPK